MKEKRKAVIKCTVVILTVIILCIIGYFGGKQNRIDAKIDDYNNQKAKETISLLLKNNGNNLGTYLIAFDKTLRILDMQSFQYTNGKQLIDTTKDMTEPQKDNLKKSILVGKKIVKCLIDSIEVNLDRNVDSVLVK